MRRVRAYFIEHARVLTASIAQLLRAPLASTMTILVIGITLALPSALYVLVENAARVARGWDTGGQISVFLKANATDAQAEKLAERLRRHPAVARTEYLSRAAALAEFKRASGFGDALDVLDRNPLPPVVIVYPARSHANAESLQVLLKDLERREEVDLAQLDLAWVKRLHAMLAIVERAVLVLAALLGLAVILTIGNTIRLAVLNRREEIEVMKLIGATNAYIRRPFLYTGLFQGLAGAGVSWALVVALLLVLDGPTRELATLYGSSFSLAGLEARTGTGLILFGGLLGWIGSRVAVGRHLSAIDPA
ncbi:MAG: permease-like cell division protein FtsX [Gammaproteobacteria bacterium]